MERVKIWKTLMQFQPPKELSFQSVTECNQHEAGRKRLTALVLNDDEPERGIHVRCASATVLLLLLGFARRDNSKHSGDQHRTKHTHTTITSLMDYVRHVWQEHFLQ